MKQKAFLNEEEIRNLQKEEAASAKVQKKTPEQLEAIYRSGKNILVSASAGSGKTFVMAERILDQLMRGVAISQLFISTFTVKAATELKERLEKKISEQVQSIQDLDVKQHLVQQLADLPNAAIGTMDSFTQKFLMQHGYLLDIRPNFRILQNQTEQTVLKNEAFQAVFDAYYQSKEQEAFKALVKNFADRSKDGSGFRKQVYTVYTFLQSTSSPKTWLEDSFLKGFAEADFAKEKTELAQKIKDTLWELEAFLSHHMRVEAQEFPKASYLDAVQFVLDEIASLTDLSLDEDFFSVLRRVLEIAKEKNGRALANASRKAELKPLADAYNEERKEKVARLLALSEDLTFLDYQESYHQEMWEMGKTFQHFMRDFLQAYDKRKREENAFEFADISHYAIQILEDYPHVRTRYQERFHEIMVDEYQDTNHIQERMLELLSTGQNRFMVGDIKQSIYRFRQADPQIFNEKFQRYAKNPKEGELILLKENFRSSQEVLDATNYVFSHLMDQEVGEISYNQMHELVFANQKLQADSYNRARFLIYNPDKEEKEDASNLTGEMKMLVKELLYLHQQKGVSFGEMALLTATRSRNAQVLLALSEYGIPVQADGGEQNYLQSLEVQVMLDTLRTIHNPLQDYALIALMKSPMFAFEEDELARLSLQKQKDKPKENFYEKLQNSLENTGEESHLITESLREKLKQFLEVLDGWRFYARSHSLYDLIWKIYQERFYYDYVGALPNGEARQTNLYALALRADQFEKSSFKGLSRFISMINQVLESQHDLASVATTPPKDAVQLMTIHKSKGLEFPYVFLLNADQAFSQQEKQESVILSRDKGLGFEYVAQLAVEAKEKTSPTQIKLSIPSLTYQQNKVALQFASYSEQMRLLYVAMTRAEKKLYLVGKASEEKLQSMEFPKAEKGVLSAPIRLASKQFQDWIWAILHVFPQEKAVLDYQFVGEDQLTSDEIGSLERTSLLADSKQAHNRQSETIKQALKMLKEVEEFNQKHAAGIALPSVQTPSQVKKLYEPVMEMDGVFLTQTSETSKLPSFELPEFGASSTVTGAMVGSAVHELMQRIDLTETPTLARLEQALQQVRAPQAVKERVNLAKILTFFDTELGREMLDHRDKLYREQPFSFLKQDAKSKEHSVIRGILDGYLLYPDKIVLFDYKTDAYKQAGQLVHRYRAQLALYAEALREAYQIEKIEQYLILLGKDQVEVVFVNEQ